MISSYADLWHVEHSFRMSKSDLRARPLFARRRDSIEARNRQDLWMGVSGGLLVGC